MSKLLFRVIVLSAVLCIFAPGQSAWAAIEDGLISYWPFDEGSGTIAEDAVGDNDGTINGGAAWVTGKFGTALSFDGADGGQENHGSSETDHVDCGSDASLKPTSAVSISAKAILTSVCELATTETRISGIVSGLNCGLMRVLTCRS